MTGTPITQPTGIETTIGVLNTLLPAATSIIAIIGGVSVPILGGLQIAQAILPIAEKFILGFGSGTVAIDTAHANDSGAIIAALQKDVADGWPVLNFSPTVGLANPGIK